MRTDREEDGACRTCGVQPPLLTATPPARAPRATCARRPEADRRRRDLDMGRYGEICQGHYNEITKKLGAAGTRGTMWKTASASPPSGGRPRLVADHTHKEPCTKTAGRGPVPFYPSPSRGVRFIYLFTGCFIREEPPRCRLSFPRESWRKEGASCTPAGLPDQSSPTKDKNEERTLECTHTHPR